MSSPAHDLAESRKFLLHEDVDLIGEGWRRVLESHRSFVHDVSTRSGFAVEVATRVVNLGAGSGTTAAAVLCAISPAKRGPLTVMTIDINQDALDSSEQFIKNIGEDEHHAVWRCDSVKAAQFFEPQSVDYLLIDTSHEYAHTKLELVKWRDRCWVDALVWLHDYVGDYPGVTKAVDEAVNFGEFEILEQAGLGVLGRFR